MCYICLCGHDEVVFMHAFDLVCPPLHIMMLRKHKVHIHLPIAFHWQAYLLERHTSHVEPVTYSNLSTLWALMFFYVLVFIYLNFAINVLYIFFLCH